jgi:hypothetical protein
MWIVEGAYEEEFEDTKGLSESVIYEDFLYRLNNINLQQVVTMPTRNYFPITRTQQCPNSSKSTYFRP